jgi:hypothetical protein
VHTKCREWLGFDFVRVIQQRGNEFLIHIVRVTGDETWLPFGNVETKEQAKHWMHSHSQNKLKKFKQMLSAEYQLFSETGTSADGGIHATKNQNVRSVL